MRKDLNIAEKARKFNNAIYIFQLAITGAFLLLIAYLFFLQVFDFKKYVKILLENSILNRKKK